jgi:hypothetical protein
MKFENSEKKPGAGRGRLLGDSSVKKKNLRESKSISKQSSSVQSVNVPLKDRIKMGPL